MKIKTKDKNKVSYDPEWVALIIEAKKLGLSAKEILQFIKYRLMHQ